MSTKERIQQTALEMFASKGCDAVSIRDIAYSVGIKESTIYYHFKSKQDIIDQLHAMVEQQMEQMKARFLDSFDSASQVTEAEFVKVALHYRYAFFESPPFAPFIAMLSIERHASTQAEALYQRLLFSLPLEHQERVFHAMCARGIFKASNAALLAREYHYLVFGAFMSRADDRELTELIERFYRRGIAQ